MADVPCTVRGVFMAITGAGAAPVVILDAGERGSIPIYIGLWEALAIHNQLQHIVVPRPLTHDLIQDILEQFGITVTRLQIDAIEDGIYYAQLHLKNSGYDGAIDCRPSDGIAIAMRAGAPIIASEEVVASAAMLPEDLPELIDLQHYS